MQASYGLDGIDVRSTEKPSTIFWCLRCWSDMMETCPNQWCHWSQVKFFKAAIFARSCVPIWDQALSKIRPPCLVSVPTTFPFFPYNLHLLSLKSTDTEHILTQITTINGHRNLGKPLFLQSGPSSPLTEFNNLNELNENNLRYSINQASHAANYISKSWNMWQCHI